MEFRFGRHTSASARLLIYFLLTLVFLFSNSTSAKTNECVGYLNYSSQESLFSAGTIKDITYIQNSLTPFPQINRTLTLDKIQFIVKDFEDLAERIRNLSTQLPSEESEILIHVYYKVSSLLKTYKSNVNRKDDLAKKRSHLIQLSNVIKGAYFEGLIGILLIKNQFENIETNSYVYRLLAFSNKDSKLIDPEDYQYVRSRRNTELDFIAHKDGINYIIEVKSFTPDPSNPFLLSSLEGLRKQVQIRKKILSALELNQTWRVLVIFHYGIGEDLESEFLSDADSVYSLYNFSSLDRPE